MSSRGRLANVNLDAGVAGGDEPAGGLELGKGWGSEFVFAVVDRFWASGRGRNGRGRLGS